MSCFFTVVSWAKESVRDLGLLPSNSLASKNTTGMNLSLREHLPVSAGGLL